MSHALSRCALLGVCLLMNAHSIFDSVDAARAAEADVYELGDRRELFVDRHRIASLSGAARLQLHEPRPAEIALKFDSPWDGEYSGYVTVFRDGDKVRMYYRGWKPGVPGEKRETGLQVACLAESTDGRTFTKPNLGLVEFAGSKDNNLVWGHPSHNFTPFKDARPGVPKDELYKALQTHKSTTGLGTGLAAFYSADGVHWRLASDKPVKTKGAFDSQNLAFWDPNHGEYRSYYRIFTNKVRAIAVTSSSDFQTWSEPTPIELSGDAPAEHYYTNATTPYFRAPHYYFAFPKRFVPSRSGLEGHRGVSDGVFLSSRDGVRFDRTFREAFIRPGRDPLNWGDRSSMVACGIVQTGPDEMSVYYSQNYRYPTHHMRRGVLRLDGIGSVRAGADGGELVTNAFRFTGRRLTLNYATSAAGSVQVEVQDAAGTPLAGFTQADATELFGDKIEAAARWKGGDDVTSLAGKAIRLRFVLRDADVFSYRFE